MGRPLWLPPESLFLFISLWTPFGFSGCCILPAVLLFLIAVLRLRDEGIGDHGLNMGVAGKFIDPFVHLVAGWRGEYNQGVIPGIGDLLQTLPHDLDLRPRQKPGKNGALPVLQPLRQVLSHLIAALLVNIIYHDYKHVVTTKW